MSETPNENGLSSARIMIRNVGPRPSVFTQVDLQRKGCVFYSTDNFFWLSQGEERVLNMQVKCDANASAEPGMWTVSSWNAASEKLLKR